VDQIISGEIRSRSHFLGSTLIIVFIGWSRFRVPGFEPGGQGFEALRARH